MNLKLMWQRWNTFMCWLDRHDWTGKPFASVRMCRYCKRTQVFTKKGWVFYT